MVSHFLQPDGGTLNVDGCNPRMRHSYDILPCVPFFYFVMGAVFSSINPLVMQTLAATMVIFAVTMGAVPGSSAYFCYL